MKVKLLSRPELEDLLRRPTDFQPGEELGICTIVEPVLLADLLAKGKSSLDWSVFQQGWDTLLQRGAFLLRCLIVIVCSVHFLNVRTFLR